jgi:hypothetical protein
MKVRSERGFCRDSYFIYLFWFLVNIGGLVGWFFYICFILIMSYFLICLILKIDIFLNISYFKLILFLNFYKIYKNISMNVPILDRIKTRQVPQP